jgi:hypothetical protein
MRMVNRRYAWATVVVATSLSAIGPVLAQSGETPVGLPVHEMLEDPFNRSVVFDVLELRDRDDLSWDARSGCRACRRECAYWRSVALGSALRS